MEVKEADERQDVPVTKMSEGLSTVPPPNKCICLAKRGWHLGTGPRVVFSDQSINACVISVVTWRPSTPEQREERSWAEWQSCPASCICDKRHRAAQRAFLFRSPLLFSSVNNLIRNTYEVVLRCGRRWIVTSHGPLAAREYEQGHFSEHASALLLSEGLNLAVSEQ